jgi:hypothetical protein
MQIPSKFKINPPNQLTVLDWLSQFDARPKLIAEWPEDAGMALVCVQESAPGITEGYVLTTRQELEAQLPASLPLLPLLFLVPKSILYRPNVVPGLVPSDFD